jgi:hypothetical protein
VFAVRRVEAAGAAAAPLLALKVSVSATRADLSYEFEQMMVAGSAGHLPVVPIEADSLRFPTDTAGKYLGGGFLLRGVHAPFEVTSAARCASAFESLRALHAAGYTHGDARLPNLLATGPRSEPRWIDMRAAARGSCTAAQRADAAELAASVLETQALPPAVAFAMSALWGDGAGAGAADGGEGGGAAPPRDSYDLLASAVYAAAAAAGRRGRGRSSPGAEDA